MPKYLLLKRYRGGPEPHIPYPPMDEWAPEDVEAHMAFLRNVRNVIGDEYVDAQALAPAQTFVRYGGPDAAPVTTDGPHPETSDLVAGWYMIDVDSYERAVEVAAYVSSEPGPGGEPLCEWIDVREIMSHSTVGGLSAGVTEAAAQGLDEGALRALVPRVLAGLVRRGEDFDAAEDALQEALIEALRAWPEHPPRDPRAWLTTVATRRLVDARRSEAARRRREEAAEAEPRPRSPRRGDDTLFLLFICCHPDLAPASQVALTLRAVGGLTTAEIADAFYVPEATMAQRISRAKRTLRGQRLGRPGDLAVVLRVLYLVYTAGHTDRTDLAGEAIRLARQLTLATDEPEARGLLALMLLNHARLPARIDGEGRIVPLDRQDRSLWDEREIAEGVRVLQSALAVQTDARRRAGTRSRPPSPPCTTMPRAPRRPTGRRSSPGTTTSSPSPRTRLATSPPPSSAAPSRSATSAAPPPGSARPTACATCSASGTAGTPYAGTCSSSAGTATPLRRPTPKPPDSPRTSPSATT